MKFTITLLTLLICSISFAQNIENWKKSALFISSEILLGKTAESNWGFPETVLQKQFVLSIGRDHSNNSQEWAQRLKKPKTGVSFGITDFGNIEKLGYAFSVTPFISFKTFRNDRMSITSSMGASYFNKKYDSLTNIYNNAVTTNITWAFRMFFNYKIYSTAKIDIKITAGIAHHSNGHVKLLNQGYNSFLVGISGELKNPLNYSEFTHNTKNIHLKNSYSFFELRAGFGQNVLGLAFNELKDVYTVSSEFGKVYKNTFKLGIVLNYRFYEHYYNYIKGNESLVQHNREFETFKKKPWHNASNLSLGLHGEILLNHIGINYSAAYNIYKPSYKIEWRINQGWDNTPRDIPENWLLGEYGNKYELKQHISSRLGLKYYLFGTATKVDANFFIGAFLNANWGQADFTEIACGYVYNFNFKK